MCPKTWNLSVLQACIREAKYANRTFTNRQLLRNQLPLIIKETQTKAKTPERSANCTLRQLRNLGFMTSQKRGNYTLTPYHSELMKLVKEERTMSKGECLISTLLRSMGVTFEREKTFEDLRYKGLLRLDFYLEIEGKEFAIEFDGVQHKRPVAFFGGCEEFKKTQIRDKIKTKYCASRGIKLIRINEINYDKVRQVIEDTVLPEIKR